MTTDRWRQVEELCHSALEHDPSERGEFLRQACAGDDALRHDVETLLVHAQTAEGFLVAPLGAVAADLLGDDLVGRRLGSYEVVARLGAGGMGEVYRARDSQLGRDVAIKVLPSALIAHPDRLARFEREARVLALLNHPNIGAIYGLERLNDAPALILELVDGQTLAERIGTRPSGLGMREVLSIARSIAEALEAAHDKGIVHRDLKPANIKITPSGVVKVLDFGLAKPTDGVAADLSQSPTFTTGGIREGVILGTPAYMSPEQARGQPADKRSDIWAFGCVLYEMLTGRTTFAGVTVSDHIAAILERDPDWAVLPRETPSHIRRLLKRCLEKNLTQRLQAIGDARIEIDDALRAPEADAPQTIEALAASGFRRRVPLALAVALALAAMMGGSFFGGLVSGPFGLRSDQGASGVTRALIGVGPADQLRGNSSVENLTEGRPSRTALVLSPDGRSLVFSAVRGDRQQLYVRALDQLDAAPIAGTEGGASPFFSPDGRWVGFWTNGALKKVALTGGGGATTICELDQMFGASWGSNDTIVFARAGEGLWQVPADGGTPRALTRLDLTKGEVSHRLPQVLPGNGAVLFTVTQSVFPKWEETHVVVQSLVTGERKDLVQGADARYVATGHLVYARAGTLLAVPFDLGRLEVTGGAVSVIPAVMQAAYMPNAANDSGAGQFSVSASGALLYLPGGMFPDLERSLLWVDRAGTAQPLPAPVRAYFAPRLSPDGQRLLVWTSGTDRNVWVYDIPRGTLTRLTTEGRNAYSVWTPDGKRVTFSAQLGPGNIFWQSADGTGTAERLTTSEHAQSPSSWSPDGQTLAFIQSNDIWVLPLAGDRRPHPIVQTRSVEAHPEFSPDGHWLAYTSNESGRTEVYVQPYPGPGPRVQVSINGGFAPAWARDGRELFYEVRSPRPGEALGLLTLIAVPVTTRPTFVAGAPNVLFQRLRPMTNLPVREYDVAPDGRRFLMLQDKERLPIKATEMILVQNWVEELNRLVPRKDKR